jgi:two-component system response regulator AtoC
MSARLLIVDDDATYARALSRSVQRAGHDVAHCLTAREARDRFTSIEPEVVILDYQLPDADGLALLDDLRRVAPAAVFLLNTAYPNLDVAVEAMRRGAFDYVAKDHTIRECLIRIERAVEVARLRRQVVEARQGGTAADDAMIGDSPPMQRLRQRLEALAVSDDTTAFIVGETGVGKGVVARQIHAASGRVYEPFVAVDCTTIPATLVESELFGHEPGAFTDAKRRKLGKVEAAGKGTLFLDEIGELELPIQAKLLRLLEEGEFNRVGETKVRTRDARVIAATNRDLSRAVQEGRFRADLRYRLEVFVVEVPPLRDRGDDVLKLAHHFAAERARGMGREVPPFADELLTTLKTYPFPGNIRELKNMVEQAMLLSRGESLDLTEFPVLQRYRDEERESPAPQPFVDRTTATYPTAGAAAARPSPAWETPTRTRAHAPPTPADLRTPSSPPESEPAPRGLSAIRQARDAEEKTRILQALEVADGNVSKAAEELGLSRYQLYRRLKKHGLS